MALDLTIITLLGFWLTITLLYATPLCERFGVKRVLLVRLVPQWNFFAPNPGTQDFHLLYRDQLVDGSVGPWRECADFTGKRPAAAPIWHPEKRAKKTLYDITAMLITENLTDRNLIKLSIPHLLALNYVAALPRSSLSTARQFVLIETCASDPKPNVVFLSGLYSL